MEELSRHTSKFDMHTDPTTVGTRWRKWVSRFDTYLLAANIDAIPRKKAQLLWLAGEDIEDLYDTLKPAEDDDTYVQMKDRLTRHFDPQVNTEYDKYVFSHTEQESGESIDQYYTKLRSLARNCQFHNTDAEIKSQIIQRCQSETLRRRCLRDPDMNIGELLNLARTLERTEIQAKGMEKPGKNDNGNATSVNRIQKQTSKHKYKQNPSKHNPLHTTQTKAKGKQTCRNCGGIWPHINGKQSCPAYGRKCHSCSRSNHFARCCRSKEREKQAPRYYKRYPAHKVAVSEETDGSDEECVCSISSQNPD